MKYGFRRWIAALLLVCTLASFVVPATFADTTKGSSTVVDTYDMVLADHEDSKIASATSGKNLIMTSNCKCKCGKKLYQHIAGMYEEGTLNWCVLAATDTELYYREDKGNYMRITDINSWAAFKVRVSESGNFTLTNTVDLSVATSSKYITAYAFPASAIEGAEDLETAIAAKMTDATKLGKKKYDSNGVMTFGEMEYTAGEYVFVFEVTGSVYLNELALSGEVIQEVPGTTEATQNTEATANTETTESTEAQLESQSFNIALYKDEEYASMFLKNGAIADKTYTASCGCGCGKKIYEHIKNNYSDLNWMLEGTSYKELYFRAENQEGFRLEKNKETGSAQNGDWVAFRLNVQQTGTFTVTVKKSYTSYGYGADVFIFPAEAETMDNEALLAAMANADKAGAVSLSKKGTSAVMGDYDFTAGEYIFVMKHTSTDDEKMRIYVDEIVLDPVVVEETTAPVETTEETTAPTTETTLPEETTEATTEATTPLDPYNHFYLISVYEDPAYAPMFTLDGALKDRTYKKNCYDCGKTIENCLASHYNDLGWKLEGTSFKELTFLASDYERYGYGGLRLRNDGTGNWVAFRIKVGAPGFYSVMVGRDFPHYYQADMYIFPAEAEKMSSDSLVAAMTGENKIGRLNIAKSETMAIAGYKEFDKAGEYIIVMKNPADHERIYINAIGLLPTNKDDVPETTAPSEDPTTQPTVPEETVDPGEPTYTEGFYNFALYTEPARAKIFTKNGEVTDLIYTNKCGECGKTIRTCLANQYTEGSLNWVLERTSFGEIRMLAATAASKGYGGLRLRFDTDENGKVFYVTNEDGKKEESETPGNWAAFRVKVDKTGTFTVTVNKDYEAACTMNMYIIPATAATMSADAITAAMTDENKAGAVRFTKTLNTINVCDWNFETAGEYIIILKTTGSTNRMYLNSITLTVPVEKEPVPASDEKIYDFNLPAMDPLMDNCGLTARYNNNREVRVDDIIKKMYDAGQIHWMYENRSYGDILNKIKFTSGTLRYKSKVNARDLENEWVAYRIKNPGTATYDVRLVSAGESKAAVNIYLIPTKDRVTLTTTEIKAGIKAENLLVSEAIIEGEGTFYLGEFTFGVQDEYVIVFEFVKGTFLYMSKLQMTLDGRLADTEIVRQKHYNGTVYDFDLADSMDGVFTKSTVYANKVMDQMNELWYSGKLNWKWFDACSELRGTTKATASQLSDNTRFYRATGMRIFAKVNYWNAFRIKSPGNGTFTLSVNHGTSNTGGTLAVYILPGDTKDVEAAMDHSNRVGLVALYNDGSSGTKDGFHTYMGYWDFEAGKEYILVMEAYENSPYSTYCYMNISQIICERGKIDFAAGEEKKAKAVTVASNVVPSADPGGGSLVTEIGGHDYYFLPLEGGSMLVYDLDTRELVDKVSTGYAKCYGIGQAPDGTIWLSGDAKYLIHYDPITKKAVRTTKFTEIPGLEGAAGSRGLYVHSDGIIYFGTYHDAQFASYDPEEEMYTVYGDIVPNLDRIMGIVEHDGYLYMSAYDNGSDRSYIGKFEIATGKVVAATSIEEIAGLGMNYLRVLGDGDLIVGGYSGTTRALVAINPKTMEVVDTGLPSGINANASENINGKHYMVLSGGYGVYQYDVATKEFSIVPGMTGNATIGFKMATSVVTIEGEELLMTNSSSGGSPRFYNMETKEVTNWTDLVVHGDGGADILNILNGPAGSNEIHIGVFNVHNSAIINTETNELIGRYKTGGQGDSAIYYNDKLYYGNYSSTTLNEIYIDRDNLMAAKPENEVIQRWKLNHEETGQKRVHSLAAGDGYVFAGTIPDSGQFGGSLVVYDTRTGRWYYERNIVQDQAVKAVAYSDKVVYGGTTIQGGSGTTEEPRAESAMIFAYDYENRQLLGVLDPRDYISGFTKSLDHVSGIAADPVVEGRMWAVVSETMIAFTFDKETKKFDVQQVISFSKGAANTSAGRSLQDRNILFDVERSKIYFSFDTKGGMQCLEIEDMRAPLGSIQVTKNTRIMSDLPKDYVLSEQGDLYYATGGTVKMLPCNVTEEDWAIAEEVDAMILAIDSNVTLESEVAIKSARSAYDNLSLRYKALVQELDELRELEVDLLECKIAAVDIEAVDADTLPLLQSYVDTYDGMTSRYQKYVKNYDALQDAHIKATGLNDARLAAALQERIDALKDRFPLTLDDEPEVLALRAEYDAMTVGQRVLVDTTILEDAEAQIKVLRAELVKYVEELIQAIPKEITLDAADAITLAREYADKLYVNERKQVSYAKLTSAEGKLRTLKNAKAAAEEVDALIDAIGFVTLGDKERIVEAREAYDALKDAALEFVKNGEKLEKAEWMLKAWQTWLIPTIVVVIAGAGFCVVWFVPSLRNKVFKSKKKEEI